MGFTQSHAHQYRNEGYTFVSGFLNQEQVKLCLAELERICDGQTLGCHDTSRLELEPDQSPDGAQVRRVYDPCTHYPLFRAIADSDTLLQCVEPLIGPDILFTASKINMKPAKIGSVVRWHQDFAYGPLTNTKALSVLFYLNDADETNGCLQVLAGRHEDRLMDHTRDGFFQGQITKPVDDRNAVSVSGGAGTAIFLHCMTPHASVVNQSTQPRRTLIAMYRAADAFPVMCGPMSIRSMEIERLVRGQSHHVARFSLKEIAIPVYPHDTGSLYQLQEQAEKT